MTSQSELNLLQNVEGADISDAHILHEMLETLHNALQLSDRFMYESQIKIIYMFLLKNPSEIFSEENKKTLREIFGMVCDMMNNTYAKTIFGWLNDEYDVLPNIHSKPPVPEDIRKAMEKRAVDIDTMLQKRHQWQEENPEKVSEKKALKKVPKKFKVNDIVGVKDREKKWHMARVIYVFEDDKFPFPWYYVHFHNWHDNFREWIGDSNRIKPYMPERDFFRR